MISKSWIFFYFF